MNDTGLKHTARPLSPHLQIYRPQITSVLSIVHRATGILLSFGLVVISAWLIAAAGGEEDFTRIQTFLNSIFGKLLLFGWTLALFFHLANGIRHLAWDLGFGYELSSVDLTGKAVLAATLVLTVIAWIVT